MNSGKCNSDLKGAMCIACSRFMDDCDGADWCYNCESCGAWYDTENEGNDYICGDCEEKAMKDAALADCVHTVAHAIMNGDISWDEFTQKVNDVVQGQTLTIGERS